MQYWKSYKYKNITLFAVGVLLTMFLSRFEQFHSFLLHLGSLGYFGAFIAGMLWVSTFTVSIGIVALLVLAEQYPWLPLALVAATGAVLGDFLIFRFVRGSIVDELKPLYERFGGNHLHHLLHSRYFSWTLPVLGAVIVMSPLPDEIGVTLMGISKMKTWEFVAFSFLLDTAGVFLIMLASIVIKP